MKWYADRKALRKARLELRPRVSQTALAEKAGMSRATLANLETGRQLFTPDIQRIVWKALARITNEQKLRAKVMDEAMGSRLSLADLLKPSLLLKHQAVARDSKSARALIKLQDEQIAELQSEIVRLKKQNNVLRQWLASEEKAAHAHHKAARLREKVTAETENIDGPR